MLDVLEFRINYLLLVLDICVVWSSREICVLIPCSLDRKLLSVGVCLWDSNYCCSVCILCDSIMLFINLLVFYQLFWAICFQMSLCWNREEKGGIIIFKERKWRIWGPHTHFIKFKFSKFHYHLFYGSSTNQLCYVN